MTQRNIVNLVPDKYVEQFLKAIEYNAYRWPVFPEKNRDKNEIHKTRRDNNNDMQ